MLKYSITVEEKATGKEMVRCDCNAFIIGISIKDEAVAFHISGTDDEMTAIVDEINNEIESIFREE